MYPLACRMCALLMALLGTGALAQEPTGPVVLVSEPALLVLIHGTSDSANRIQLLTRFADLFPDSPALLTVLRSLQAEYTAREEIYKAMVAGQQILRLYPADLEAAEANLKMAVQARDFALIRKYAGETWRRAAWLKDKPGKEGESAGAALDHAESMLSFAAVQDSEAEDRQRAMDILAALNPDSPYLPNLTNTTADRLASTALSRTAPVKDPSFAVDMNDPEALIAEAERLTRRGNNYARVYQYSQRALELLEPDPAGAQPDYERKVTAARWMSGMAATIIGRYAVADRDLRAALPRLKGNTQALGITLYSLGYVNYRLAEEGQRKRIFEAIRFNQECAAIPGPYREQAVKNIEAIKIFYNMK
jgi:hypothetical protein